MPGFRGASLAEPLVGEVVATRTFRVDNTGTLLPLFSHEAWYDGPNTATCSPPSGHGLNRPHTAPGEDCECGFYAYGTSEAAGRNRNMRHVQAIVSCWGGVVAGTQGIRAEHARIDALWLSPHAPAWLVHRVRVRYPSAQLYADRSAMLAEHPLSVLPCYETPAGRATSSTGLALLGLGLAAAGFAPWGTVRGSAPLFTLWLALLAGTVFCCLWCLGRLRTPGHVAAGFLFLLLGAWLLAPALGLYGWLVRVPLLHAALVAGGGWLLSLRPHHFPVLDFERPTGALDRRF